MEHVGSFPGSQNPATCSHPDPVQSSPRPLSDFLKIQLRIILPSTPISSKWSLSFRFLRQTPVYTFPHFHQAECPAHLILLDLITRIIFGEQYRSCSCSLCSPLHSPLTLSLLGRNIFLRFLSSSTPSLRYSLNVKGQVSNYRIA